MKKKILIILILGLIVVFITLSSSFASWPLEVTPAIEGRILDATTGEPIENSIVEVDWDTSVFAFVDRTSGSAGYMLIVTGKDGKYKVPSKVMLQPLGGFFSHLRNIRIVVRHPLYESKDASIVEDNIDSYKKEGKFQRYDAILRTLKNKYKYSRVINNNVLGTHNSLMDDLNEAQGYATQAKKMRLNVNWEIYFNAWTAIVEPYRNEVDFSWIKNKILK